MSSLPNDPVPLYDFNPGTKTWKIHAHKISSITDGNLVLQAAGENSEIYFAQKNNEVYKISDLLASGSIDYVTVNSHPGSISIGQYAMNSNAGTTGNIAIGHYASYNNSHNSGTYRIAIGTNAGYTQQQGNSIAIGYSSGANNQGANCISIGYKAGETDQASNSIILNANTNALNAGNTGFFVNPIRSDGNNTNVILCHDMSTNEIKRSGIYISGTNLTNANVVSAQNFNIGGSNVISAARQGNFRDIEMKNNSNQTTFLAYGDTGNIDIYGNLSVDNITEKTSGSGITLSSVVNMTGIQSASNSNKLLYNATSGEITYQPDSGGGGGSVNHLTIEDSPGGIFIGENVASTITAKDHVISIGHYAGHTNSYTATTDRIAIGNSAGYLDQQQYSIAIGTGSGVHAHGYASVAIGKDASRWWSGARHVCIGLEAGYNGGAAQAVQIGYRAGYSSSNGWYSVAIGKEAANSGQGESCVHIGDQAGGTGNGKGYNVGIGFRAGHVWQDEYSVSIGPYAGFHYQSLRSVAIGLNAGRANQGAYCVAIGNEAGKTDQAANSIVLNAQSAIALDASNTGFFVKPIRNVASTTGDKLCYDSGTGEISYQPDSGGGGGGGGEELTLKYPLQTALIQGPSSNSEFGACTITNNTGTRMAVGVTGLNLVKVYEWSSGSWVQMGTDINAPTGWWGQKFGRTLDFDELGDHIIVGSPHPSGGGGGAYVFQWNGSSWAQKGANIIPASSHWWAFGSQVCINSDGSIILVSANRANAHYATQSYGYDGRIYAYQWNGSSWADYGNSPAVHGYAGANGGGAYMGHSLKLSPDGNSFIAGAPGWAGTTNMGYLQWGHFVRYTLQNGTWTDQQVTYPSIPRGWAESVGVGITGTPDFNKIAVVVGGGNTSYYKTGSVYILELSGNEYVPYGSNYIIDGEGGYHDFFGSTGMPGYPQNIHMSSDGTVLAVGSILNEANYTASNSQVGQVRVYKFSGDTWSLMFKTLFGENVSDYFGALDLNSQGTKLTVGASQSGAGNGYIKTYDLTDYTTTKLTTNASLIGVGNDVNLATDESSHYTNDEIENKSSDELKYGTQGQYLVSGGPSNPMKWISKPYASFVRPWNAPQFTIVANSAWTEINWTQVKFSSGIYLDSGGYHFRVIRSGAYNISVQCRFGGGDMWTGLVLLDKDEDYVGRGIIAQSAAFGTAHLQSDLVHLNILAEINETQHCVLAFYRQDGDMSIANTIPNYLVGHQMVCNITCVS